MADFPIYLNRPATGVIHPSSAVSPVGELCQGGSFVFNVVTGAWPSANLAIFVPFQIETTVTAYKIAWENGATQTDSIDVGIYDINAKLLVSLGSTALSGANIIQVGDITDTVLTPGNYFSAMVLNGTTGLVGHNATPSALQLEACGMKQMASAFPLPTNATFSVATNAWIPSISISTISTI